LAPGHPDHETSKDYVELQLWNIWIGDIRIADISISNSNPIMVGKQFLLCFWINGVEIKIIL
jgi:hypothetical protein